MQYSVDDFDYECPEQLIAQRPTPQRDGSRLLVLRGAEVAHKNFIEFPDLLEPGDLVVVNASKVIKARLKGIRENGRVAEILLVQPEADGSWLAMVHPGGKLKKGRTVSFGTKTVLTVQEVMGGGLRKLSLSGELQWQELMHEFGGVPLPPYITRSPDDSDAARYQTIFGHADGSVAAPTAGLHFTEDILRRIRKRGASIAETVLHVGPGTFKPVQVDTISDHHMHSEWFSFPAATADAINATRVAGGRIWAIGTTVTRILETVALRGKIAETSGWTDLFVYPPHKFQLVDCLFTNFHLPRSTLLMLVCAFGGYKNVMNAYRQAVDQQYRLFSYGDAMAIV